MNSGNEDELATDKPTLGGHDSLAALMRIPRWSFFAFGAIAAAAAIWRALRSRRTDVPDAGLKAADLERSRVLDYGMALRRYSGVGTLHYPTEPPRQVEFDAGQLQNGEVIVACTYGDFSAQQFFPTEHEEALSFEGITTQGWQVSSVDAIRQVNYLPRMTRAGSYDAFRFLGLSVHTGNLYDPTTAPAH